jgi:hypothetical protein
LTHNATVTGPSRDISDDLSRRAARAAIVADVQSILEVDAETAQQIVDLFDRFVAEPLDGKLRSTRGRDLAMRNPMIYTARGVDGVDDWISRVIEDRETSAIEGHLGTFLEEVAIAVSGGVKPGSGVDLQIEGEDGVVQLYAIQTSRNTKNSGSRKSDVESLKAGARPLRASKRHVTLHIGVLHGRPTTGRLRSDPDIEVLASDEFWERITGVCDFRTRLLRASSVLAKLVQSRAGDEVDRIRAEAKELFGTDGGALDLEALAAPPRNARNARTQEKLI